MRPTRGRGPRACEALHHQVLADVGLGDDQIVDVEVVVVLGVGDRRLQRLLDVAGDALAARTSSSASAAATFLPRIDCATRFSLRGLRAEHPRHRPSPRCRRAARARASACPSLTSSSPSCRRRVAVEGAGRRELAELVADHVLGDEHRDVLLAVVDAEGQADELRQDGRAARPGLDHVLAAASRAASPPSSADSRRRTDLSRLNESSVYLYFFLAWRERTMNLSVALLLARLACPWSACPRA